ncbi:hypothetical protein Dimus_019761 [Dionaea muscipula]
MCLAPFAFPLVPFAPFVVPVLLFARRAKQWRSRSGNRRSLKIVSELGNVAEVKVSDERTRRTTTTSTLFRCTSISSPLRFRPNLLVNALRFRPNLLVKV